MNLDEKFKINSIIFPSKIQYFASKIFAGT